MSRAPGSTEPLLFLADVIYLGSALVPADQMCFAAFGAHSAEHVKQLIARAEIPYEHVVQAVHLEDERSHLSADRP